jgi:HAD superfamily phosphatase (TIGR01668 family)
MKKEGKKKMSVFTPKLCLEKVTDITPELLRKNGIKGIVLDVDNTLTLHGSQEVKKEVLVWLENMKKEGILLTIVSNNYEKRVRPFAQRLGLEYVSFGCKPLTKGFTQACRKFSLRKEEIAVVGDQIYTDILGGNLKGMFTILVTPFELETGWTFRLKRSLEKIHIRKYRRLHGEH